MKILPVLFIALTLTSCATKRYDRLQPLTDAEKEIYTCRDINLELAKVAGVRQQIDEGSEINAASVGAFLMDFGIGNAMEKSAAVKTVSQREADLLSLKAIKDC